MITNPFTIVGLIGSAFDEDGFMHGVELGWGGVGDEHMFMQDRIIGADRQGTDTEFTTDILPSNTRIAARAMISKDIEADFEAYVIYKEF